MKIQSRHFLLLLSVVLLYSPSVPSAQEEVTEPEAQAQLLSFEDMAYPAVARVARVQGIVVIRAKVDQGGNVIAASALVGPKALVSDSVANIRKWKFKPTSGKAAIIVYEFSLDEGACRDASHSLFRLIFPNFATITACNPVIQ